MPEYILKEDAVAAIDQTLVLEGKYRAIEALQALPPVSVEGDLVERLERIERFRHGHEGEIPVYRNSDGPEAAQAITVLQGRVEAVREECAKVAEEEIVEIFEDSPETDKTCNFIVRHIAKVIREGRIP